MANRWHRESIVVAADFRDNVVERIEGQSSHVSKNTNQDCFLRIWPTLASESFFADRVDGCASVFLTLILATAYEQQLPIAPLIGAFAMEHRRRFRARLTRFASILQTDPCIASALEQTPELLPDETVTAIRLGTELGTLTETFAQLLETETPNSDDVQEKWNSVLSYGHCPDTDARNISVGLLFLYRPDLQKDVR